MKMTTFKVGDKVYYPTKGVGIYTLQASRTSSDTYTLCIECIDWTRDFTGGGKYLAHDFSPAIFPATEENCEMLTKLYGVEFEKPAHKPTATEIIEHLLTKQKFVLCYVNDDALHDCTPQGYADGKCAVVVINKVDINRVRNFFTPTDMAWLYGVPFDPVTGEIITEIEE